MPWLSDHLVGPTIPLVSIGVIEVSAGGLISFNVSYQSQNAERASSQKRHVVISIFLLCNSLILMSIGAGSIRAIKGGLDKVFKIRDRLHRICRQILR